MARPQRTIAKEFQIEGRGLHTGEPVVVTVKPAPPNSGVTFVYVRDGKRREIPAKITSAPADLVSPRNTTLVNGDATIHTVEHLLGACYGLEVDNLSIEITASEPPVPQTGSYESYVRSFQDAGIIDQDVPVDVLVVDELVSYRDGDIELIATPSDQFRISFTIQFDHKSIGTQFGAFEITPDTFTKEISPARTFVLHEDVEKLREMGLTRGGSLENAIVFGPDGMMNDEPLRWPDECVRHKVLDLVGDLSLLGQPIRAHIHAVKSGHASNLQFVRKLWDFKERKQKLAAPGSGESVAIPDIHDILPHRYPFLLVDRIEELIVGKRVVGLKNVTINEPFFAGHFPGHPIMPAVLIIEAMAQAGGALLMNTVDNPKQHLVYFSKIDNARFRKPVVPGDQLRLEVELLAVKLGFRKMRGRAYVGDDLAAEADLVANMVRR